MFTKSNDVIESRVRVQVAGLVEWLGRNLTEEQAVALQAFLFPPLKEEELAERIDAARNMLSDLPPDHEVMVALEKKRVESRAIIESKRRAEEVNIDEESDLIEPKPIHTKEK